MLLPLKLFGIVFLIPGLIVLCHGLRLGKRLKREYRFDAETTGTITGISLYTDSYSDQQSTSGVLTYEYIVNGEKITCTERITKIGGHRFFLSQKALLDTIESYYPKGSSQTVHYCANHPSVSYVHRVQGRYNGINPDEVSVLYGKYLLFTVLGWIMLFCGTAIAACIIFI